MLYLQRILNSCALSKRVGGALTVFDVGQKFEGFETLDSIKIEITRLRTLQAISAWRFYNTLLKCYKRLEKNSAFDTCTSNKSLKTSALEEMPKLEIQVEQLTALKNALFYMLVMLPRLALLPLPLQ